MRRDCRRALHFSALCLLPAFLSACIHFKTSVDPAPQSDDYSPPAWKGQKVPAVVEFKLPWPDDYRSWEVHFKDRMLGALRDAELFSSVDSLPSTDPNQPYVRLIIEYTSKSTSYSCLFFGCSQSEHYLNWLTILPLVFPMATADQEIALTASARNWDNSEKTYGAATKFTSRWNGINQLTGQLTGPWGDYWTYKHLRYALFNQMKRDGDFLALAPGADPAAVMAQARAREAERQRQEQERRLAEERAKQEAERQRIAAEKQRAAEEQRRAAEAQREAERQRLAEAQREAERRRQAAAAPALPPIETKAAPVVTQLDVDALPAMTAKADPRRHAVVVGIERYRGKLPAADYAANDARVMAGYLTAVLGYPEENIAVLLNDKAARTDLEKYFEGWLPNRVEKGDSVFVYFSGHGAPNPKTGKAFIVPYDGDPAFMDQTGYPLDRLYDRLAKLPAKEIVVVLDSCFSGGGSRSVIAKGMRPMRLSIENPVLSGGSTVVLAASSGDQTSSTYDQYRHGLLTYYLLRGLRGEADRDQNGAVDLTELFDYLKPQVERTARREFNNEQTPQLLVSPQMLSKGIKLIDRAKP